MKKTTSIIASVLLVGLLISALAVNVFAATGHRTFSLSVNNNAYTHILPAKMKSNYSDMMIYIETGNNSRYYVRAVACSSPGGSGNSMPYILNCTFYNNQIIDHYAVLKGTIYSVPNQVLYSAQYASFGILSPGNPGTITGRWSEDTRESYATPIY